MSRTIAAGISTAEIAIARNDAFSLVASDNRLRFENWTTQTYGLLDTAIAQSYAYSNGTYSGAAWRTTDGKGWWKAADLGTAASWKLDTSDAVQLDGTGAATEYHCMRPSVLEYPAGPLSACYTTLHNASGIKIYYFAAGSGTGTDADIAYFGPAFLDTSSKVVRVEAMVLIRDNTGVPTAFVTAVGTHDFTNAFSTIEFYYADQFGISRLDTIIQAPLTETYTNWYSCAKWATYICGLTDADNVLHIVMNSHPSGQAKQFKVKLYQWIESALTPCVPVDPTYGTVTFRPASMMSFVTGLYFLSGRLSYGWADGTSTAFDCYLTSTDCEHWSIGERNFYIQDADSAGYLFTTGSPNYVYYGGNGIVSRALGTPALGYNTATKQATYKLLPGWNARQVSNGAHSFNGNLVNAAGALLTDTKVGRGAQLDLYLGQGAVTSKVGVFDVDSPTFPITGGGYQPAQMRARDLASKAIIRHNLPIDIDWWGQDALVSDLSSLDGLIVQTNKNDVAVVADATVQLDPTTKDVLLDSTNGLRFKGLNNPFVAYADVAQASDMLMKATVIVPANTNQAQVRGLTLGWGGVDEWTDTHPFNGVQLQAESTNGDGLISVYKAVIDPYDPTAQTGGYVFDRRYQGWVWHQDSSTVAISAVGTAGYNTHAAYEITSSENSVDIATFLHGGRVYVYAKPAVHAYPSWVRGDTWAGKAGYTLITDYKYDGTERMYPAGKSYPVVALSDDVWAATSAFASMAVGDMELQLTAAANGNYPGTTVSMGYTAGVAHAENTGNLRHLMIDSWTGPDDAVWIGRVILFGNNSMKITAVHLTDTQYINVDEDAMDTDPHAIQLPTAQDTWGWASSRYKQMTITDSAANTSNITVDPGAVMRDMAMKGRAAFANDDGSAHQIRLVSSDGAVHTLYSGSVDDTGLGWDTTNPIAGPNVWRIYMRHGWLFDGSGTSAGFGSDDFYAMVDQEIVYVGKHNALKRRYDDSENIWTGVHAYYAPLKASTGATTRLYNWKNGGGDVVGDALNTIPNPTRLLVEVTNGTNQSSTQAPAVQYRATAQGTAGGYPYIDITPSYPHDITGPTAGVSDSHDHVILSGRAALGTLKATHDADAAVCYYPVPLATTAAIESFITMNNLEVYSGARRSVEDALDYMTSLAGVRSASFRNYQGGTAATTDMVMSITTAPTTLQPLGLMNDFVLDAQVHIDSTAWLQIDFRGVYRLALRETSTGIVTIGLQDKTGSITPGGLDTKPWIEYVPRTLSTVVLCPAATDNVHLIVSVDGDKVNAEINGQLLWVFNLSKYLPYYVTSKGDILISYSAAVASNSATLRLPELWQEVRNLSMRMGSNTASQITQFCNSRYIRSRATQTGGLLFSQFTSRDDAGTLTAGIKTHTKASDDQKAVGMVMVAGNVSGAYINENYVANEGFSFNLVNNPDADSVTEASLEAQLYQREAAEFASVETINATARIADEVEDVKTVVYAPGSNAPAQASEQMVITAIDWACSQKGLLMATYNLRSYNASFGQPVIPPEGETGTLWPGYPWLPIG